MEKAIKEKVKVIEKDICENFDKLDMDDPVEEGYFDEYEKVSGANDNDFYNFEKEFNFSMIYGFFPNSCNSLIDNLF